MLATANQQPQASLRQKLGVAIPSSASSHQAVADSPVGGKTATRLGQVAHGGGGSGSQSLPASPGSRRAERVAGRPSSESSSVHSGAANHKQSAEGTVRRSEAALQPSRLKAASNLQPHATESSLKQKQGKGVVPPLPLRRPEASEPARSPNKQQSSKQQMQSPRHKLQQMATNGSAISDDRSSKVTGTTPSIHQEPHISHTSSPNTLTQQPARQSAAVSTDHKQLAPPAVDTDISSPKRLKVASGTALTRVPGPPALLKTDGKQAGTSTQAGVDATKGMVVSSSSSFVANSSAAAQPHTSQALAADVMQSLHSITAGGSSPATAPLVSAGHLAMPAAALSNHLTSTTIVNTISTMPESATATSTAPVTTTASPGMHQHTPDTVPDIYQGFGVLPAVPSAASEGSQELGITSSISALVWGQTSEHSSSGAQAEESYTGSSSNNKPHQIPYKGRSYSRQVSDASSVVSIPDVTGLFPCLARPQTAVKVSRSSSDRAYSGNRTSRPQTAGGVSTEQVDDGHGQQLRPWSAGQLPSIVHSPRQQAAANAQTTELQTIPAAAQPPLFKGKTLAAKVAGSETAASSRNMSAMPLQQQQQPQVQQAQQPTNKQLLQHKQRPHMEPPGGRRGALVTGGIQLATCGTQGLSGSGGSAVSTWQDDYGEDDELPPVGAAGDETPSIAQMLMHTAQVSLVEAAANIT